MKIELLMREFNLNSAQFAEEVGIKNSTLSHILNDRNKPSLDVLKKILGRFPKINPEWLILDIGKMFRPIINSQEPSLFDDIELNDNKSDIYVENIVENNIPKNVSNILNTKVTESSIEPEIKNEPENVTKIIEQVFVPKIEYKNKNVSRIIIYYDDNTFEEFDSKRSN